MIKDIAWSVIPLLRDQKLTTFFPLIRCLKCTPIAVSSRWPNPLFHPVSYIRSMRQVLSQTEGWRGTGCWPSGVLPGQGPGVEGGGPTCRLRESLDSQEARADFTD